MQNDNDTYCAICGCVLCSKKDTYGKTTLAGRGHRSRHHHIAERFFGRSKTRPGTERPAILKESDWPKNDEPVILCYECHEELIHNPILLKEDLENFSKLVIRDGCSEIKKEDSRDKIARRIILFHEVIETGLKQLLEKP